MYFIFKVGNSFFSDVSSVFWATIGNKQKAQYTVWSPKYGGGRQQTYSSCSERMCVFCDPRAEIRAWYAAFEIVGWQTVTEIKSLGGMAPSYIKDMFKLFGSRHGRELRDRKILAIPTHRSQVFDRSFAVSGTSLWNSLPDTVRSSPTLTALHRGVLAFLRSREWMCV